MQKFIPASLITGKHWKDLRRPAVMMWLGGLEHTMRKSCLYGEVLKTARGNVYDINVGRKSCLLSLILT